MPNIKLFNMKKLVIIFSLVFSFGGAYSQTESAKNNAKKLLEITGSAKLGIQMMNNLITTYKQTIPEVPSEFWDNFLKESKPEDLINMMIPVYLKYYTENEILKLIEFYGTPLGKKVIEVTPLISQDSYTIGTEWGTKIAENVIKKLKEKGYKID